MTAVAPGSNVSTREVTPTAYLWDSWAAKKSVASIQPSSITYQSYTAYIYEAQFAGLTPDTEYRYMFEWESGSETFRTSVPTTRTWPNPEDIGDFSFIAYGDNRYATSSPTFNADHRDVACLGILGDARPAGAALPKFVLHVGDFVYDGGHADEWIPHFFRPAGALVSRMPLFPCVGNHETNGDSSASNYRKLFTLPDVEPQDPDDAERWYSFDYGNCHFVVLDTHYDSSAPEEERDDFFDENSEQHGWLRADLSQSGADWKVVVMHVPAYTQTSNGHGYYAGDVSAVREQLAENVFNKAQYGVRLVLSGHNHFYERSRVSREGGGTVNYIVTGGGGAPLHSPFGGDENPYRVEGKAESVRHYCRVELVQGGSRLSFRALREDGSEIDSFTLK